MGRLKLCLILLTCLCWHTASALDVSEWSGTTSEELWKFFHRHKTKPVIVINAEGTLWPSNILLRFFRYVDTQPHIRQQLMQNRSPASAESLTEEYKAQCEQNREACYIWAVSLFSGIRERILFQWSRDFWDNLTHSVYLKPIGKLIQEFQKQHFPIWVITPIPQWIAEIGALKYDIGPSAVIATKPVLHQGITTQRLSYPVPYEIQKVFLVDTLIKTKPFMVLGHHYKDFEVLSIAESLSVVINPPKDQTHRSNLPFITAAKNMGWHIQDFPKTEY